MKSGITLSGGGILGKSVIEAVRQMRLSVVSTRLSPCQEHQEAQIKLRMEGSRSSPSHVVHDN